MTGSARDDEEKRGGEKSRGKLLRARAEKGCSLRGLDAKVSCWGVASRVCGRTTTLGGQKLEVLVDCHAVFRASSFSF